jgi:hypothetical protein
LLSISSSLVAAVVEPQVVVVAAAGVLEDLETVLDFQ